MVQGEAEVRGCRVELVFRVREQLPEWLQESVVARQEAACMPGPVARQYVLGEGQVAGGKICRPKPAVAAGELAVDEPVVREEKGERFLLLLYLTTLRSTRLPGSPEAHALTPSLRLRVGTWAGLAAGYHSGLGRH